MEAPEGTEQYLDQRDLFSKLQHFKPLETLTATDLRGLDPEDVQFLVRAQMGGNEQQRLMLNTAMNHLSNQQARMDNAKTEVGRAKARQELEKAKHQMKMLEQETKFQQNAMLNMAKTGNSDQASKARTVLGTQYALLQNKLMQTEDPQERQRLHELSQEIIHHMISIQDAKDPEKANAYNSLTQYQKEQLEKNRQAEYFNAKMKIADPETPPEQKQVLMEKLNRPDSPVYFQYIAPQEAEGQWNPFKANVEAVEEQFREILLPPHHVTGEQATLQDVYELADALDLTVVEAIEVMRRQYQRNAKKVTQPMPDRPTQ
jgi:hypothetical protein